MTYHMHGDLHSEKLDQMYQKGNDTDTTTTTTTKTTKTNTY